MLLSEALFLNPCGRLTTAQIQTEENQTLHYPR